MAVPKPKDQEFNEESYNYDYATRSGWGIRNARANFDTRNTQPEESVSNNYTSRIRRFNNNERQFYTQSGEIANTNDELQPDMQRNPFNRTGKGLGSEVAYVELKAAKKKAKVLRFWILSWWSFWWAVVQIWASIAAMILFGAGFETAESPLLDIATNTWTWVSENILGMPSPDIKTLFFVAAGVSFFTSIVNFGITWFIYEMNGIESVYGKMAAGLKYAMVMLVIIGGLPGLSLIPWFYFWIRAVTKYPQ